MVLCCCCALVHSRRDENNHEPEGNLRLANGADRLVVPCLRAARIHSLPSLQSLGTRPRVASGPTQFLLPCVRAHAVSSTLRPGPRSFFNFASGPKVASTQRRNFLRVSLLLNVRPTNTQRILQQIFLLSNLRPKMEEKPRTLKKRKLLARSCTCNG